MDEATENDVGLVGRVVRAIELIASAHAARARDEAGRDIARLVRGVLLAAMALVIAFPILLLLDLALVIALRDIAGLRLLHAVLAATAVNASLAIILAYLAKRRLALPVLVETRKTLKRALVVVRGS